MKKLFRLLSFVKGYKPELILNILFNVLAIVFSIFSFSLLMPFLDLVFQKTFTDYVEIVNVGVPSFYPNPKYFLELFNYEISTRIIENPKGGKLEVLLIICITTVVSITLKNVFLYLGMYFGANVRNGVIRDIRAKIYHKLLVLDVDYFTKQQKGDLMSRASNDIQEIQWTVLTSIEMLFRDPIAIVFIFSFLFALSTKLTLFVLVVIPLTGALIGIIGSKLRKSAKLTQEYTAAVLSVLEETISGLKIIKGFGASNFMGKRFDDLNHKLMRSNLKVFRQKDLASPMSEFLAILILVGVIWYGGRLILVEKALASSEFIGFLVLFSQIIPHAKSLATAQMNLNRGAAAADRIDDFTSTERKVKDEKGATALHDFKTSIELKNIHFSYSNNVPILKGINLIIPKGKTVALVGPSGGGKSTLLDVIARFYDPVKGQVLFDGKDSKSYLLSSLASHMGMVTQDTFLFHDTVANNIAFNSNCKTINEVKQAAKIAFAHDFIEELEQGYNTLVGDRGTKLSGGQRQRLSIARAVLKDPDILLLDEATSALDTESEQVVQKAIAEVMKGRTSIVIAHRLSTIQNADLIVVIDQGRVVEKGTHQELMNLSGMYKKLHDMQSF